MRGVQWDGRSRLRCGDCGGYEIDLLEDGRAHCRTCSRTSIPRKTSPLAGVGRAIFWIFAGFLALLAVEALLAWLYASGAGASFVRTFSLLAFFTGLAALAVAGIGASPGRTALGTQRLDRLGRMYPLQDPVVTGTMTAQSEPRPSDEPGSGGVLLMGGLAVVLLLLGFLFGIL